MKILRRISTSPVSIADQVVDYCVPSRVVVPAYAFAHALGPLIFPTNFLLFGGPFIHTYLTQCLLLNNRVRV